MASIISASTTSSTALNLSGDTTGILQFATGATPTTAVTIDASQNVGIGVTPLYKLHSYINNGSTAGIAYPIVAETNTSNTGNTNGAGVGFIFGSRASGSIETLRTNLLGDYGTSLIFKTNAASNATGTIASLTEYMRIDASGNVFVGGTTQNASTNPIYSSTTAKSWVNFAGAVTPTINASFNVSSITFVSTGNYTINFTSALVDAKYVVTGTASANGATVNLLMPLPAGASKTTGLVTVSTFSTAGAAAATTEVNVAIFR